ncbi:hypothetical protein GCM10008986_13850 [Salinibacillus aidingensis]|uniref:Uncharacterized protein n=1 Tax=Salinibacillus aidingensis TaxID=237684 RepID=A0ABP3KZ29_9BACI
MSSNPGEVCHDFSGEHQIRPFVDTLLLYVLFYEYFVKTKGGVHNLSGIYWPFIPHLVLLGYPQDLKWGYYGQLMRDKKPYKR